jgi:hypothetical protein
LRNSNGRNSNGDGKNDASVHGNLLEKCKAEIAATMERMALHIFSTTNAEQQQRK